MFEEILVEKDLAQNPRAQFILQRLRPRETIWIDRYEEVFGRVKKPYLQKRDSLRLYLAQKRGELVKKAPDAYGLAGEPHYYFVHAYNCIYECEYCYLQGYFHSPDIVVFLNREEIKSQMEQKMLTHPEGCVWFHAGEFSDSLALSHLTGELEDFWPFFIKHSRAKLELRTKSANLQALKKLQPLRNAVVSFSLAPEGAVEKFEHKTAPYRARLLALKVAAEAGFSVAVHLDPIVDSPSLHTEYVQLLRDLSEHINLNDLMYISLGVVRFADKVFGSVKRNYPQSDLWQKDFVRSKDGKFRYYRPERTAILESIRNLCLQAGCQPSKVYLCMED